MKGMTVGFPFLVNYQQVTGRAMNVLGCLKPLGKYAWPELLGVAL